MRVSNSQSLRQVQSSTAVEEFIERDPDAQVAAAVLGSVIFLAGPLVTKMPVTGAILDLKNMRRNPFVTDGDGLWIG